MRAVALDPERFVEERVFVPGGDGDRSRIPIRARPFTWIEPRQIPPREWLYGRHYARKFVSVTVSPGGIGKSSLVIVEALVMASGRDLLGIPPPDRCRCWLWNGEDPLDELQRRVMAAAVHHDLGPDDFEGRLFVDSGRETEIVIAEQLRAGITISVPTVDEVKSTIRANRVDVVIIDPFVSSHRVGENDNNAIDRVAKVWAQIADETNCAIELVHHSRKTGGAEVTMEDGRGASALLAAARAGRVLNVMTEEEAAAAGVEKRRLHFRVDDGKANLAPPAEKSTWYRLASVDLGNGPLGQGDSVGVVTAWEYALPDPLAGITVASLRAAQKAVSEGTWREDVRAVEWVGKPVAAVLGLDLGKPADKAKVRRLLDLWTANGMFRAVEGLDSSRRPKRFVEVGTWATN